MGFGLHSTLYLPGTCLPSQSVVQPVLGTCLVRPCPAIALPAGVATAITIHNLNFGADLIGRGLRSSTFQLNLSRF